MVVVILLAITQSRAGSLVCKYTNEVLTTCCCAQEKTSPVPAVDRPCCCRTMVVGELPHAVAIDDEVNAPPVAAAPEVVVLASPSLTPTAPTLRPRLHARETGPPPSAPERLARLQVFQL